MPTPEIPQKIDDLTDVETVLDKPDTKLSRKEIQALSSPDIMNIKKIEELKDEILNYKPFEDKTKFLNFAKKFLIDKFIKEIDGKWYWLEICYDADCYDEFDESNNKDEALQKANETLNPFYKYIIKGLTIKQLLENTDPTTNTVTLKSLNFPYENKFYKNLDDTISFKLPRGGEITAWLQLGLLASGEPIYANQQDKKANRYGIDGKFGAMSKAALRRWQQKNGIDKKLSEQDKKIQKLRKSIENILNKSLVYRTLKAGMESEIARFKTSASVTIEKIKDDRTVIALASHGKKSYYDFATGEILIENKNGEIVSSKSPIEVKYEDLKNLINNTQSNNKIKALARYMNLLNYAKKIASNNKLDINKKTPPFYYKKFPKEGIYINYHENFDFVVDRFLSIESINKYYPELKNKEERNYFLDILNKMAGRE